MKVTNKQLRQIIKEELNRVLNENENHLQKLVTMLKSEDSETFNQAIQLTNSLEPFHRAEVYDIIKSHISELKKQLFRHERDATQARKGINYRVNPGFTSQEELKSYLDSVQQKAEMEAERTKSRLLELENLLSKFETSDMVYVNDPMME